MSDDLRTAPGHQETPAGSQAVPAVAPPASPLAGAAAADEADVGEPAIATQRPGANLAGPPVVEVRQLDVTFTGRGLRRGQDAHAVDGVDLQVMPGEIVALAGESGCGKTTLARTLLGLEKPTAGEVAYQGSPLRYSSRALKAYRRKVQLVLQDPTGALNPRQSVYEAVAEGIRIHKLRGNEEELVARALSLAGLRPPERFFLRYPHELSGGQRQRVVIAGALALEPSVIVADEPVSSLDASVRGEILALLLKLRDEMGLSVLVVTHDLGLAWNIADRIAVMYLGRIVEVGPTEDVLANPSHPYTKALLSVAGEGMAARTTRPVLLKGEPPDSTRIPDGCRFHPRCPALASGAAEAAGVAGACRSIDLPIIPAAAGHAAACHLVSAS
jgi:oligopeptide/dipeptide ABC transporter ATP-binding protein